VSGPPAEASRGAGRLVVPGLVAAACLLPVCFAAYTEQAFEDFLIAFRHSVHLAEGHGLTYQPGRRIQGFSSPLAVLLLAAAHPLAGGSVVGALWAFRVVSIAGFALGLLLLLRALRRSGTARGAAALLAPGLVYVLDLKSVYFSANGMETGLLLFFFAASLACLAEDARPRGIGLGAAWAGLLWTRMDGAVYLAAMAVAALAFTRERRATAKGLLRAALVCAALYLPWFVAAWAYYGTPIPQSVAAKAAGTGLFTAAGLARALPRVPEVLAYAYLPPFAEFGRWSPLGWAGGLLGLLACGYWLLPKGRPFGRRASFVTLTGVGYLALMPQVYPWYYPPVVVASLPALAALLSDLAAARRLPGRLVRAAPAAFCGAAGIAFGSLWLAHVPVARLTQRVGEDGNRRLLGEWLAAHARPTDRVFLECPGYIGFYSGLEMLDYPGLVAPSVVAARRRLGDDFAGVAASLAPEWMVLRSEEVALFEARSPGWLGRAYSLERSFDVSSELYQAAPDHPGILYDGTFHVFRRR
jgi:hypothetical protein